MPAPASDLTLVPTISERVKASSIVGKWVVCISTKGKVRASRPTAVHFPTTLVSLCVSLREKFKESVRDRLPVLPLPLGGVGETPREVATPPEVVRRLEETVEGDLLILQNARLSLAITSQEEPVPSGTGVLSSITVDKQEGRTR